MQRFREFIVKAHEIGNELFGERIKDMYEIQTLATNPAAQGRGYGSALVRHVINKVLASEPRFRSKLHTDLRALCARLALMVGMCGL